MKKILYILSIALLGATACSVQEMDQLEPKNENGKVTYIMGLQFPEVLVATRGAMDTDPIIDNVYVAVFGDKGYLNDYAKAEPCNADGSAKDDFSGIQNGVLFYYKVSLTASSSQKYVHVIANGPEKLDFAYDKDIMPNLTTDAGNGAYWTMFSLPNGTSVKDADGYDVVTDEAKAAFSNLKLIRNFAKVTVTNSASNFVLEGYKVFNTPDKGRIVTWKEDYNSADERLKGYYTPYVGAKADDTSTTDVDESTPMTFTGLQTAGYTPSLAAGAAIDQTVPTTSMTYANASQFVFERVRTNQANRPYIIIKGQFNGSSTSTYYRLDFTDKDGNYIPIFRNFKYDINITTVPKAGVADPANAQPSNANVSALLTTQSLTDLADGTSRILVQYLDKTFMTSGNVQFQYLYLRNATQAISQTSVTPATFKILSDTELAEAGKPANTTDPAFTVDYADGTNWGTSWNSTDKWQEVTLKIADVGNAEKRTTFRLTGTTANGDKLFRDVTIHVLQYQSFNTAATDVTTSGSAIGSTVTYNLRLADNLPSSVFPLEIAFEDSEKRLNPSGTDMPARVGTSIVTGKSDRSYQFVKSISFADYNAKDENGNVTHVIPCVFKRISAGSTTLYMKNEYFNNKESDSINIPAN